MSKNYSLRIPKKLSDLTRDILEALYLAIDSGLTVDGIKKAKPKQDRAEIAKAMHNMANAGSVTKGKTMAKGGYVWHITERGAYIWENIDQIEVYKREIPVKGATRKPTTKTAVKPLSMGMAPPVEPVAMNISATADKLADFTSELINENRGYRDLMLNVYDTIGKALQLGEYAPQANQDGE